MTKEMQQWHNKQIKVNYRKIDQNRNTCKTSGDCVGT